MFLTLRASPLRLLLASPRVVHCRQLSMLREPSPKQDKDDGSEKPAEEQCESVLNLNFVAQL